jgi:hypothetical protein
LDESYVDRDPPSVDQPVYLRDRDRDVFHLACAHQTTRIAADEEDLVPKPGIGLASELRDDAVGEEVHEPHVVDPAVDIF